MIATLILWTLFLTSSFLFLTSSFYFSSPSRYLSFFSKLQFALSTATPTLNNSKHLFVTIAFTILILNVFGNIPGIKSITLFYWFTVSLALSLWIAVILSIYYTQLKSWVSHLLPYGSPIGLSILLPLIEAFSHLIRPFTLIIRLRTNLSSGHIILYIFSFFAVSSFGLTTLITPILVLLMLLEIFVSALQAYIFSSLLLIYLSESSSE
jgi:F-type H+-transporting ATPase subunit a